MYGSRQNVLLLSFNIQSFPYQFVVLSSGVHILYSCMRLFRHQHTCNVRVLTSKLAHVHVQSSALAQVRDDRYPSRPLHNCIHAFHNCVCPRCRDSLGPSHTKRPRVGFLEARQRRYKILLIHPVCGVCAARFISDAWRQNHASRGIELVLFLTPDAWY